MIGDRLVENAGRPLPASAPFGIVRTRVAAHEVRASASPVCRPCGWLCSRRRFHSGSVRIASMIIRRHIAVAAGDLRRQAGQRHQRVHEVRIRLAPQPGVHPAHRGADHQPQVVDPQPFGQQPVLGLDHVVVAVVREPRAQAVARLARLAVADAVREDDEVAVASSGWPGPNSSPAKISRRAWSRSCRPRRRCRAGSAPRCAPHPARRAGASPASGSAAAAREATWPLAK